MLRTQLLGLAFALCATTHLQAAESWAERLGYPSGKRVLILHANHMGAAYEFNRPGQELLTTNRIQSVGVMTACPWFEEFAKWSRENPGHDTGICLSLNSPSRVYRWGPLLDRGKVPSLVDSQGFLWRTVLQVALRAEVDDVKREVEAQIRRGLEAGIRPTHLLPDMGSLLTREDLTKLYLDTAQKFWIPAVIIELTPENIESIREAGFPLTQAMIDLVDSYPLPKLDDLRYIPEADSYDAKRKAFFEMIRELPPGLTQIITLPADRTPALENFSPRWEDRVWEARLLNDSKTEKFLADEGVVLTNWIEVMHRFENGRKPSLRTTNTDE